MASAGGPRLRGGGRRRGGCPDRLVLRAAVGRLLRHADARLRSDRLVDRLPVDQCDGRRQWPARHLAARLGLDAGGLLLAVARHGGGGYSGTARAHLLAVRHGSAGLARLAVAGRGGRDRPALDAVAGLRAGRRLRGAGGGAVRLSEGQRVPRQPRHPDLGRRPRHGAARRHRHRVWERRRGRRVQGAFDLAREPDRLFEAGAGPRHRGPGRGLLALSKGAE